MEQWRFRQLKKVKAIALFSGGLDSMIAVKVIREQGIDVLGVAFSTPFFGAKQAEASARQIALSLLVLDITDEHLAMVKAPRYGYGRNMNPCIDCHTLMIRIAGRKMAEVGADFLFTGEVLGQRPMSQNKQMLHVVAKNSGFREYVLRPLCAKLLPETVPERTGLVDREKLFDIQGRGRKRQMALAETFGIAEYSNPAGGCLLTDPMFSRRLRDLFGHQPDPPPRDIELLKAGRHFRLNDKIKVIVGRNRMDNLAMEALIRPEDNVLQMKDFPGPLVLIPHGGDEEIIRKAAAICTLYSDAPKDAEAAVQILTGDDALLIATRAALKEDIRDNMI
jgi:tRNA-uridine 2-sulfurtransferase